MIVGLGNPGKEYEKTRHNAGIILLNQISNIKNQNDKSKFKNADYFEYLKINNILFIKFKKYMNESGVAVKAALKYFKVKPEEILIVHDDSDIEAGKYKISFNRGAAGHRGVESIIKSLKTKKFWRFRIGVRPCARKIADIKQNSAESCEYHAERRENNKNIQRDSAWYQRKSASRIKAGEFVLKNFSKEELENLKNLAEQFSESLL